MRDSCGLDARLGELFRPATSTELMHVKRIMGRVCLHRDDADEILSALREAGYVVAVMPLEFQEDPDLTGSLEYVEATRTVSFASDTRNEIDRLSGEVLDDIQRIVGPTGICTDAGPIDAGHEPFQYDTAEWTAVRH